MNFIRRIFHMKGAECNLYHHVTTSGKIIGLPNLNLFGRYSINYTRWHRRTENKAFIIIPMAKLTQ